MTKPHGFFGLLFLLPCAAFSLNNGAARLPPMGWSSYNCWGGYWSDATIKATVDSMAVNGLRDCGYVYINIDGSNNGDTPYFPGKTGFVAWAKPLADYAHAKNLKLGVYMMTTANAQASVNDLVSAGIDFVKHDDWLKTITDPVFVAMRDALVASGKPIVYSINTTGRSVNQDLANMCRTGGDIARTWVSVMQCFDANYQYLAAAKPGAWPDPDMMEVGNIIGTNTWFTPDEDRAQFTMWCMMGSPLIAGYDFSKTSSANPTMQHHVQTVAIHANTELIAVDQDTLKAGRRVKGQGTLEVWVKDLRDSSKAVTLFNRTAAAANISVSAAELGFPATSTVYIRDLWAHQNLASFTGTLTQNVNTHGVAAFRMSLSPIGPQTKVLERMDRSIAWLARNGYEVFPQRLIPSIIAGAEPRARAFDVRGRAYAVDPRTAGSGLLVLRAMDAASEAQKFVWPRATGH